MFRLAFLLVLYATMAHSAGSPLIRVLVIDSGYDTIRLSSEHLCATGHRDFTGEGMSIDRLRHGSNVVSLIQDAAGSADYCIVVYKIFELGGNSATFGQNYKRALRAASELEFDIVNLSLGGTEADKDEIETITNWLDRGRLVVAAAGNLEMRLEPGCNYYPACIDERVVVVGCSDCSFSNRGSVVDVYEHGMNQLGAGVALSGTSMATAIVSGKLVKYLSDNFTRENKKWKKK
jgi:hypothetical protein